jgi:1-acyl-sn-glycerol-3-phosphate acyltransferase
MVIMTLMLKHLSMVKPVAAMDYFLRNRLIAWFSLKIIGILPIKRKRKDPEEDVLVPVYNSLEQGNILILFPEGSRGEPEKFQNLKSGIARISAKFPDLPVVPIFFYGLGKALPKGEALLVPFFCDVFIGEALYWSGDTTTFMDNLNVCFQALAKEAEVTDWE